MQLIRGLHNLRPSHRGCVATIGNFDGVHRGHRAVLANLAEQGRAMALPTTLVCFEPTPQEHFLGAKAPARLTPLGEKLELLQALPVDRVLMIRFDAAFAALSPQAFIDRVLVRGLGARHVTVGDDFRFGARRAGDYAMLEAAGREQGFSVGTTPTLNADGERVSSSRIRDALAAGEFDHAAGLLGRRYVLAGRVRYGDQLGRTLDVPTVNIALRRRVPPVTGIFVARVHGAGPDPLYGAGYIGDRPAVTGNDLRLEVHLLDFAGNLYGRRLAVEPLARLREDRPFATLDALQAQMHDDIDAARRWLAAHSDSQSATATT